MIRSWDFSCFAALAMTNAFKKGVFKNGVFARRHDEAIAALAMTNAFKNGVFARRHDEAIAALAMTNNNTWKNSITAPQ